jgi:hypothetical protein
MHLLDARLFFRKTRIHSDALKFCKRKVDGESTGILSGSLDEEEEDGELTTGEDQTFNGEWKRTRAASCWFLRFTNLLRILEDDSLRVVGKVS